jgi:hypothetical protein
MQDASPEQKTMTQRHGIASSAWWWYYRNVVEELGVGPRSYGLRLGLGASPSSPPSCKHVLWVMKPPVAGEVMVVWDHHLDLLCPSTCNSSSSSSSSKEEGQLPGALAPLETPCTT